MEYIIDAESLKHKLDDIREEAVQQALKKACLLVENEAKKRCPIDTGHLVGSIKSEVDGNEGTVGTNVEYAPYIEYGTGIWAGTSEYGKEYLGTGRQTPWSYQDEEGNWHTTVGQKPQPFLIPAFIENEDEIEALFLKTFNEVIHK